LAGPGSTASFYLRKTHASVPTQSKEANGYATERSDDADDTKTPVSSEDRRAANAKELERLAKWSEDLKLKKRDLLRSDVQGNKEYEAELAEYSEALTKATTEREALGLGPSTGTH